MFRKLFRKKEPYPAPMSDDDFDKFLASILKRVEPSANVKMTKEEKESKQSVFESLFGSKNTDYNPYATVKKFCQEYLEAKNRLKNERDIWTKLSKEAQALSTMNTGLKYFTDGSSDFPSDPFTVINKNEELPGFTAADFQNLRRQIIAQERLKYQRVIVVERSKRGKEDKEEKDEKPSSGLR